MYAWKRGGGADEHGSRNPMEALFKLPEERVISEFVCAKKRRRGGQLLYHGRLYVSQNYVCFRAKTITGATKDVVLHLGDFVHMGKSRHAMINPAIRIIARHKRYFFTSFFPYAMRDHASTIIAGQWALFNAAVLIQRSLRAHLARAGRGGGTARFPFKLLYRPCITLDRVDGVPLVDARSESRAEDFGADNWHSFDNGYASVAEPEPSDATDRAILSDLRNGVHGLDEQPFQHIIKTFEIPTTLKRACELLLSDSSAFTEGVHLANQDASKAVVGKWRPSAAADEPNDKQAPSTSALTAGGRSREVTFVQKIDNPLSPIRQGRGSWYQRAGWLSSGVLIYQTHATIKDVPFADSWAIKKKWTIRPAGDAGLDSPVCQVTCSLECIFYRRLLWSGKMESETISTAAKDYALLAGKMVAFIQAAEGGGAIAAPPVPHALARPPGLCEGESEVQMLRRRLAEAEEALRQGALVQVGAPAGGWLGGLLGGAGAPAFVLRAALDPQSDTWTWQVGGKGEVEAGGKARVIVRAAGAAAPLA